MKLKEFFVCTKELSLAETDKFLLYQKILSSRTNTKKMVLRYVFARKFIYGFLSIGLVFLIYGIHFFHDDIRYFTHSIIVQKGDGLVQAGYIARIIHFNGPFFIEHNNKQIQSSIIHDGDIVTLRMGTHLVFTINETTQAKIVGPAKFIVGKKQTGSGEKEYTIQLLEGDFIELQSLPNKESEKFTLVSPDVIIRQAKGTGLTHFQLGKSDKGHYIKNIGSRTLHINKNNIKYPEHEKSILLETKQILAVAENDITLIHSEQDLVRVIAAKNISQTIAFESTTLDSDNTSGEVSLESLSGIYYTSKGISEDTIDKEIINHVLFMSNQTDSSGKVRKSVISPEQNTYLKRAFHSGFLVRDVENLYNAYTLSDKNAIERIHQLIYKKLVEVYKMFGIPHSFDVHTNTVGLDEIIDMTNKLHTILSTNYYVSPRYLYNLHTFLEALIYVKNTYNQNTTIVHPSAADTVTQKKREFR